MIEYLQKFLLGSLMLYGVFYLFLRNEKTFRFNRFYLLLIMPLSLTIPFLTVKTSYVEIPVAGQEANYEPAAQQIFYFPTEPEIETSIVETVSPFNWQALVKYIYLTVSLILLWRFVQNIFKLNRFKKQGEIIDFNQYRICLREDLKTSFTFLSTIFTNKSKYKAGLLPESIFKHEIAHVQQKHSYDIILIEVLTIALWFNPVIYLIRRSIKLNHEFLADEQVYQNINSPQDYQRTLINYSKINSYIEPQMASRLTYGETKKRLKMMVKTTHKPTVWMKQSIGLATIATAIFIFGNQKVIARDSSMGSETSQISVHEDSILLGKKVVPRVQLSPETKIRFKDISGDQVESEFGTLSRDEKVRFASPEAEGEVWTTSFMDSNRKWRSYQNLLESARPLKKNEIPNFFNSGKTVENKDTIPPKSYPFALKLNAVVRFLTEEGDTIKKTYKDLSPAELERFKENEAIPAFYAPKPAKMDIPENFATIFSDEKEYGVWLDGKRIKNSDLKNYSASEIHHYYKSVLLKNAKNYGVHAYQLNIYTDKYMEGKPDGTWINLLTIPEGGIDSIKKSEANKKPSWDKSNELAFKGFDTTRVEYFRVPTRSTHVKFVDQKKNLIVAEWQNLSMEQKRQWYTNGHEGMIFSPPKAKTKIDFNTLIEIIEDSEGKILLNGKKVDGSLINTMYPHEFYDFEKTVSSDGKTTYQLTSNEIFLTKQYYESFWISNVLYKKSESDD